MRGLYFFLTLFVFSVSLPVLPVMAGDTSTKIEQLKGEVHKLLKRIEELEKKQAAKDWTYFFRIKVLCGLQLSDKGVDSRSHRNCAG